MEKFCYSCGAPLSAPDFAGPVDNYCKYCVTESGELKSREEVKQGIAGWMKTWHPDLDDVNAQKRAEHYLLAMPAWAE